MSDLRLSLLKSIETCLYGALDPEEAGELTEQITIILGDYEVTERCTDVAVPDTTNEKILKLYCGCLVVDGKSEKTIYQYRRVVQRLGDFVGKPFPEMGVYDIRFFLASEKQRGMSDRSVENLRSNLSAFFSWLTDEEMIVKNPMNPIKPITYTDEIREAFSDVEIDKLRSACETTKERALVEVLLSTGVRVSELSLMNVGDIDVKNLEVNVLHGKGAQERKTFITPVAMAHLEKYLAERPEKEEVALFCNKDHERLRAGGIRHVLIEVSKRAGVDDVHPHRFRRTFATLLAKRGMDVREIQKLLGHKNLNTTMLYINTETETVKASYRRYVS